MGMDDFIHKVKQRRGLRLFTPESVQHLFGVEVNKEVARALYGPYSYSQHNDKVQSPR